MKTLIIINDPPYGNERMYNGLRLALALLEQNLEVILFLMADGVSAAKVNQQTPNGYYNIERMLKRVATSGKVLMCGTCMDARGISDAEIIEGSARSTMHALALETIAADKVLVF